MPDPDPPRWPVDLPEWLRQSWRALRSAPCFPEIAAFLRARWLHALISFLFAVWALLAIGMGVWALVRALSNEGWWPTAGTVGDLIGGISNGIVLGIVLIGVWLQHRELAEARQQRDEQIHAQRLERIERRSVEQREARDRQREFQARRREWEARHGLDRATLAALEAQRQHLEEERERKRREPLQEIMGRYHAELRGLIGAADEAVASFERALIHYRASLGGAKTDYPSVNAALGALRDTAGVLQELAQPRGGRPLGDLVAPQLGRPPQQDEMRVHHAGQLNLYAGWAREAAALEQLAIEEGRLLIERLYSAEPGPAIFGWQDQVQDLTRNFQPYAKKRAEALRSRLVRLNS